MTNKAREAMEHSKALAEKAIETTESLVHTSVLVYGIAAYLRDMTAHLRRDLEYRKQVMSELADNLDMDICWLHVNIVRRK